MFGVLIPEVEGAITAGGAKSAMNGVEGDCVDGVDVVDVAVIGGGLAMALEAEVGTCVFVFDILDGTATLDTAYGETGGVRKTADYPRLPLEGGLQCLVEFGGVIEIDDVDVPVCCTDN